MMKQPLSPIRRRYMARLIGRILVLITGLILWFVRTDTFTILEGWRFFDRFSILHLLWLVWVYDMAEQLWPVGKHVALGSQKLFRHRFRPILERVSKKALKQHVLQTTRSAFWVLVLWCLLIAVIGALRFTGFISETGLFMITLVFYVCDLICVLIWCPFRLILKNRCCTTCRIFNWDHLMMFSPLVFTTGFYNWSLILMSIAVVLVWEGCVLLYPERFWEKTNAALTCANCTDKLCTQYCQKLRR